MLKIWTVGRRLGRAVAGGRRLILIVAATGVLCTLASCSKSSSDSVNNIKPILGTIALTPPTNDPAVYFEVPPSNGDPALLDVMFRSTVAPTDMIGFTLEIHYDQGVVNLGGELADGTVPGTPLGDCGVSCMASCGVMNSCKTCAFCDSNSFPKDVSGQALICGANLNANQTGVLLIGVATTPTYSAVGCQPVSVSAPVRLARLHLFAASTGTSRITLVSYPNNSPSGGCAILGPGTVPVDQGIPCFDGGAVFTAAR